MPAHLNLFAPAQVGVLFGQRCITTPALLPAQEHKHA
jgi:hypothetical protein